MSKYTDIYIHTHVDIRIHRLSLCPRSYVLINIIPGCTRKIHEITTQCVSVCKNGNEYCQTRFVSSSENGIINFPVARFFQGNKRRETLREYDGAAEVVGRVPI